MERARPLARLLFDRHLFTNLLLPRLCLASVWWLYCTCQALRTTLAELLDVQVYREARMCDHGDLARVLRKRFKHRQPVPLRCEAYFLDVQFVLMANKAHDLVIGQGAAVSLAFVDRFWKRFRPEDPGSYTAIVLCGAMRAEDPAHFEAVRNLLGERDCMRVEIASYYVDGLRNAAFAWGHPEFALRLWPLRVDDDDDVEPPEDFYSFIEACLETKSTACLEYALKRWPQHTPKQVWENLTSPEPSCSTLNTLRWSLSMLKTHGRPAINYEKVFGAMWENTDPYCMQKWFAWLAPLARAQFDARWRADPATAVPWEREERLVPGKLKWNGHYLWDHPWNKQ